MVYQKNSFNAYNIKMKKIHKMNTFWILNFCRITISKTWEENVKRAKQ